MKSDFEILTSILTDADPQLSSHIVHTDNPDSIFSCQTITFLPADPRSDVLYCILTSRLPRSSYKKQIHLICYLDSPAPGWLLNSPECDAMLTGKITFNDVQKAINELNTQRNAFRICCRNIMDALYRGNGLQAISDNGSLLFGNPVFIWDSSFKAIALPQSIRVKNPFVLEDMAAGFISPERMSDTRVKEEYLDVGISGKANIQNGPISEQDTGFGWGRCPVKINGLNAAYMIVYAENTPLRSYQTDWLQVLAQFTAMELGRNPNHPFKEDNVYEELLADIIEGRISDRMVILKRLRSLKKELSDFIYMVVLRKQEETDALGTTASERKLLHSLFPNSISAPYKGDYIYLISGTEDATPFSDDEETSHKVLANNGLLAGVSNVFSDVSQAATFYTQATKALQFAQHMEAKGNIFYYFDFSLFHAIEICTEEVDLRNLCHPGILKLLESERASDTELLQTLYLYIAYMKDVSRVTEILHIHRSTLFYRLGKIKKMLHMDFDNGNDVEKIMFSMKLMEYMETYPITPNDFQKRVYSWKKEE